MLCRLLFGARRVGLDSPVNGKDVPLDRRREVAGEGQVVGSQLVHVGCRSGGDRNGA